VELVVSDDHGGLKAAIARHFQGASHQRCLLSTICAHSLLGMVGYHQAQGARRRPARGVRRTEQGGGLAARFRAGGPVARELPQGRLPSRRAHIEECLTCLTFPESHRRRIRTTNGLERLNQEIKRRTRVG
jgi:putative transposase